jgi:hypothetical protein
MSRRQISFLRHVKISFSFFSLFRHRLPKRHIAVPPEFHESFFLILFSPFFAFLGSTVYDSPAL